MGSNFKMMFNTNVGSPTRDCVRYEYSDERTVQFTHAASPLPIQVAHLTYILPMHKLLLNREQVRRQTFCLALAGSPRAYHIYPAHQNIANELLWCA